MSELTPYVRELFRSFTRIHVISFASKADVYGLAIQQRLTEYGYPVSPGMLYPILHELEDRGLLESRWEKIRGKARRYYSITEKGSRFLSYMKPFIAELSQVVLDSAHGSEPGEGIIRPQ